ncbi:MAG: hypothetical protein LBN00_06455 [Oscillospiraceae bacterium]|jgi:hypothetical protein|nr:hypothetical protein [Oscillospiraceae bacterium]
MEFEQGKIVSLGTLWIDGHPMPNPEHPYYGNDGDIPSYDGGDIDIGDTDSGNTDTAINWLPVCENGKWYLIADRNILVDISWDTLNENGFVEGVETTIDWLQCKVRMLSSEEWDKWVVPNETLMNWDNCYSWTSNYVSSANRALRGYFSARYWNNYTSSTAYARIGWRPCLEVCSSDTLPSDEDADARGCDTCKYEGKSENEYPCADCANSYTNKWEPVESPRWRAEYGGTYYCVYFAGPDDFYISVMDVIDTHIYIDNDRYKNGNYYRTREETELVANKIRAAFRERLEK